MFVYCLFRVKVCEIEIELGTYEVPKKEMAMKFDLIKILLPDSESIKNYLENTREDYENIPICSFGDNPWRYDGNLFVEKIKIE